MSKKLCIVLVGGPCSGKSSAGKMVASRCRCDYISSGDIAREMAKNDTITDKLLNLGEMAPEDRMREMVKDKILHATHNIILLDGFPRFGDQARWLHSNLSSILDVRYILFNAPSWVLKDRALFRNRSDDINFDKRLDYYRNTTYKELYGYVDAIINTEYKSIDDCATMLENYIKEVVEC